MFSSTSSPFADLPRTLGHDLPQFETIFLGPDFKAQKARLKQQIDLLGRQGFSIKEPPMKYSKEMAICQLFWQSVNY